MLSKSSTIYNRIFSLVKANFFQICRQPVYIFSLAFFAVWIFLSREITLFAFGQENVMVREMGLSSILICGFWVIYFSSVQLATGEIEDKTTYTLLSKPLSRRDFVLAKFLSVFLASLLAWAVLALVLTTVVASLEGSELSRWSRLLLAFETSLWQGLLLTAVELLVLSALAVGLGLFASPLVNFLLLFSFFTLGHLHQYLYTKALASSSLSLQWGAKVFGLLVPNLELLNLSTEVAVKKIFPFSYLLVALLYGIVYTFIILMITFLGFDRKEF